MSKDPIRSVCEHSTQAYDAKCAELIGLGYELISSDCGMVEAVPGDIREYYQAIFILPEVNTG